MQRSLISLLILLDKNRENYGLEPANVFTMFSQALQILSRDDTLPRYVKDAVYESRIKIKPTDEMTDLYKVLFSTCLRALSQNQRNQQSKQINTQNPSQLAITYTPDGYVQQVKAIQTRSAAAAAPAAAAAAARRVLCAAAPPSAVPYSRPRSGGRSPCAAGAFRCRGRLRSYESNARAEEVRERIVLHLASAALTISRASGGRCHSSAVTALRRSKLPAPGAAAAPVPRKKTV
jgi:hypothetical protein